jgi:tetratricopeptide (TPR) repeat protein
MRILTALLLLLGTTEAIAQTGPHFTATSACKEYAQQLLLLELAATEASLLQEQQQDPGNIATFYLLHQSQFIRAFISEENKDFNQLQNLTDQLLEKTKSLEKNDPWNSFVSSEALLRLSLVKLKRQEFVAAGYQIRKAFLQVMEVRKKHPTFAPAMRTAGLLHMAMGSVPENYKWLANLAGMYGSINQGAKEMDAALSKIQSDPNLQFLLNETILIRAFCASHFEKEEAKALALIQKTKSTDNGLLLFFKVNTLVKSERFKEALALIQNHRPSATSYPLHYLTFQKGLLQLGALQTKEAAKSFAFYLNHFKGSSFVKAALHKLAWTHLLQRDADGYRKNMERVLTRGNTFTDEDHQAQRQAESGEIPNVLLLECRLLFDGGNHDQALEKLSAIPTSKVSSLRDQLEYTYRMARICEKKKLIDRAIRFYTSTYNNGKNQTFYFAANSALLLGNIYEQSGDKAKALEWYRKCLALRKHEYQNSIDQKAESGKNRVSK